MSGKQVYYQEYRLFLPASGPLAVPKNMAAPTVLQDDEDNYFKPVVDCFEDDDPMLAFAFLMGAKGPYLCCSSEKPSV